MKKGTSGLNDSFSIYSGNGLLKNGDGSVRINHNLGQNICA